VTFQPMAGMAAAANYLFLGRQVEYVGEPVEPYEVGESTLKRLLRAATDKLQPAD
jgi:hypothetical protein